MRLDYVGPVPPLKGGISQHGAQLVRALREAQHEIPVHSWRSQFPSFLYPGEPVAPGATPFEGARFNLRWWDPLSWWRTGRLTRPADAIFFPWVAPIVAPAFRTILHASHRPAIAIVHNPLPHRRLPADRALTRWVLRRIRGAVVHSAAGAAELRRLVPGIAVETVGHPPNLNIASVPLPPSPPVKLLFFGLVRPYKGLELAVQAVEALIGCGREVELTVAGEFWEPLERWEQRLARSPAGAHVHLRPGYIPDEDVGPLIGEHHLVVAPYETATQSGIVPLAHAAARPVVATRVGGLAEAVHHGVTGMLSDPGDVDAFADAIDEAILRLEDLSRGARDAHSTWHDVAQAVLSLASS